MKCTVLYLCLFIILLSSCEKDVSIKSIKDQRAEWDAQKIQDYSYLFQASCFCFFDYAMPARIEVRGGQVFQILDPVSGDLMRSFSDSTVVFDSVTLSSTNVNVKTIDEFFEQLETSKGAAVRDVEFNEQYGYPTRIFIDYIKNAVDDEVSYTITELDPM